MRGLIHTSLMNPWAVTVFSLTLALLGGLSLAAIPIDILPIFKNPAVQVLTFYSGMPPREVERDITNRIERFTDMASGLQRQESRSILGVSVVRNYVYNDTDPRQALASVQSLAMSELGHIFLPTGEAIVGDRDYFLNSNSLFEKVEDMGDIPLRTEHGNRAFVRDVAKPTDDAMIQLKIIMDQSVYVRNSIRSLATEGVLGAVLCSLVILLFLGRWRMTMIAILTIPLSILTAIALLYVTGQTINVMTLSGLAMAIGPMVDSAIISLENIDSHLERGASLRRASLDGPAEVALPELVANLSTLMVLTPLALMPGSGQFLFRPMAMAVAFAMGTAYILSRTFVPARAAGWLTESKAAGILPPGRLGGLRDVRSGAERHAARGDQRPARDRRADPPRGGQRPRRGRRPHPLAPGLSRIRHRG